MSDMPESTIKVNVQLDQGQVKLVADGLQGIQNATDRVTNSFGTLVRQGRELRYVGAEIDRIGKSILGPINQAADEYAKKYGQLEGTSRAFIKAQQDQANATIAFGRTAAQVLTPIMEETARFTQQIANFAAAHPELISAAVTIGGGLVAGGAALASAGTAIQSVAKAADLLKVALGSEGLGGLAGGIATAAVSVAALVGGLELGKLAVNKFGEATGNAYLASYNFGDTLKTLKEIIGGVVLELSKAFIEAKRVLGQLIDVITATLETFGVKFETAIEYLRSGIGKFINGILDFVATLANSLGQNDLAQQLRQAKDLRATTGDRADGKTDYEAQADAKQAAALAMLGNTLAANDDKRTQTYNDDLAKLTGLAQQLANFAATGTLGANLDGVIKDFADKLKGVLGGTVSPGGVNNTGLPPEAINAYIDMQKKILAADVAYAQQRADIITKSDAAILRQEKQDAQAMQDLQEQDAQAVTDLLAQQADARQKALTTFIQNEADIEAKARFDKEQRAKQTERTLRDLAAAGDVAGFIQAQQTAADNEKATERQQAFDKQQREKKFAEQQQQQNQADAIALQKLQESNAKKEEALADSQQKQLDSMKQAEIDQLAALDEKHTKELQQYKTAFAEQLAALSTNVAGLKAIHDKFYDDMTVAAQNYVNNNMAVLQQLYSQVLPPPGSTASSPAGTFTNTPTGSLQTPSEVGAVPIYPIGFATGSSLAGSPGGISRTEPGEIVLNNSASDLFRAVMSGSSGGSTMRGGDTYQISIQNTVGDVATKAHLDEYQDVTIQGIKLALQQSKGKGR